MDKKLQGRVIKAYNSFFYVRTDADSELLVCKLRGRMKRSRRSAAVLPGDMVEVGLLPDGTGVIERTLPRESVLERPAVANVSQLVLTFAARQPDISDLLLNRFLVLAEWSHIEHILICVNKIDLVPEAGQLLQAYADLGYRVIVVSAAQGTGLSELRAALGGRITVFAGPSGVGKSSLMNALFGTQQQTGRISEKIKRGRHTTRVAELIPYTSPAGTPGYVVDTPGFSALELDGIELTGLADCFPEFRPYSGQCHFSPCSHIHEPECAVKAAVTAGKISDRRYEIYSVLYNEIKEAQVKLRKKEYKR